MKKLLLAVALAAASLLAQYPITGANGGSGGGSVTPGFGILVTGSTVSADTATMLSRATDQAGTDKYCRSTTGNDTYTCSLTPTLTAYETGACYVINPDTANTGAATVNFDTLGSKNIFNRTGGALADGDIPAKPSWICYDGTQFIAIAAGGSSGALQKSGLYLFDGTTYYIPTNLATALRPSLLSLAWVNQGTSTVSGTGYETTTNTQGSAGQHMRVATLSANNVEGWFQYQPVTSGVCGIVLRESGTQKTWLVGGHNVPSSPFSIFAGNYTGDGSAAGATQFDLVEPGSGLGYGLRLTLNAGTWEVYYSNDMVNWSWVGSVAQTTPFTTSANQFGFLGETPATAGKSSTCTALSLRSF